MTRKRRWGRGDYGDRFGGYGRWAPYVPVAERRAQAVAYAKTLEKKQGRSLSPVKLTGRAIATSFWGRAWCDNLEAYSDFANRLPRGKTYVRNGSVIDLSIASGKITALVSGSSVYDVTISIDTLPETVWKEIQQDCARSIASLIDLLQGRFERGVMQRLTQTNSGLFPKPQEIEMHCSCPDSAGLCKHLAAVLYGVGARLDHAPELLFTLRCVDHLDLISQAVTAENLDHALAGEPGENLASGDLGEMFGIELESSATEPTEAIHPKKGKPRAPAPRIPARKGGLAAKQVPVKSSEKRSRNSATKLAKSNVKTLPQPKQRKQPRVQTGSESASQEKKTRVPSPNSRRPRQAK